MRRRFMEVSSKESPRSKTRKRGPSPVWEPNLYGGWGGRNDPGSRRLRRGRLSRSLWAWDRVAEERPVDDRLFLYRKRLWVSGSFGDREKAFESKWAHDEELRFKIVARRNKLLGLWAAEQMGISGDEAAEYAKSVVRADLEEPGHEDVVRKVRKDFEAKSVARSDHAIRVKMDDLLATATEQILHET